MVYIYNHVMRKKHVHVHIYLELKHICVIKIIKENYKKVILTELSS